jgi:hypothetical protein
VRNRGLVLRMRTSKWCASAGRIYTYSACRMSQFGQLDQEGKMIVSNISHRFGHERALVRISERYNARVWECFRQTALQPVLFWAVFDILRCLVREGIEDSNDVKCESTTLPSVWIPRRLHYCRLTSCRWWRCAFHVYDWCVTTKVRVCSNSPIEPNGFYLSLVLASEHDLIDPRPH